MSGKMDNILTHIEQIFDQEILIGNHDFTENEYSFMIDYVGVLGDNFEKKHYKLIFITLVEIAKRWKQCSVEEEVEEENHGYWDYVFKTLFSSDIDQQRCQQYRKVISWLGNNIKLPVVTNGQRYYATVMMHSLAPKDSIFSFYELCYNVYKKDLDFGFTSDDEGFCNEVALQIKNILGHHGYREDKMVHIGSSAYSIKIGLRSLALHEELNTYFIKLIASTFFQIDKLFNKEIIPKNRRLQNYISEWWDQKKESEKIIDETIKKKRISTVSKKDIVAKYIIDGNEVFLCIPPIRIEDDANIMSLHISIDDEEIHFEEMKTKRGELVHTTKPIEFELNKLLKWHSSINLSVIIKENQMVIFESESNRVTSLNREFILFDGEKEIFSQINRPSNYFVFSKDIDALKSIPRELVRVSNNLYNIYPTAGECLAGNKREIIFINKDKEEKLGKSTCIIGSLKDAEWLFDDISCAVYTNFVKLMIPENLKLKALELRIDLKSYKMSNLEFEQQIDNCYQFGLETMGLLPKEEPIEISLYSYENDRTIFSEAIVLLPHLEIQFNKEFYYGDDERNVIVRTDIEENKLTWTNNDTEIKCSLNDGILVVKIPYLKWRINEREWLNEPIEKKLWYKEFLTKSDLLEIDIPKHEGEIKISGEADSILFELLKNQRDFYEIGRAIFNNEDKSDISIYYCDTKNKLKLFNVISKEQFISNPVVYKSGSVFWDVENTFIGEKGNDFFLILKGDNSYRIKIGNKNQELDGIKEDRYKVKVKIKDKNIFSEDNYKLLYESEIIVGRNEKYRFKNRRINLDKVMGFHGFERDRTWLRLKPKYFVDNLELLQTDEGNYYSGKLCVIDKFGDMKVLDSMINENGDFDRINPVRIEFRDNRTLWLSAGLQEKYPYIGDLFCDINRRGICNIAKEDSCFCQIKLYKYEEINV